MFGIRLCLPALCVTYLYIRFNKASLFTTCEQFSLNLVIWFWCVWFCLIFFIKLSYKVMERKFSINAKQNVSSTNILELALWYTASLSWITMLCGYKITFLFSMVSKLFVIYFLNKTFCLVHTFLLFNQISNLGGKRVVTYSYYLF